MLHTKFKGHQPFGSTEEDFLRFLPYMGMVAILVMWLRPLEQTFVPPSHGGSIWNLTLIGPVVSVEMLNIVDDDDRGLPVLSYKLTNALWLRWAKKLLWSLSLIEQFAFYHSVMCPKDADKMASSVDPNTTSSGAVWSWTSLIWVCTHCPDLCVLGLLRY